MVKFIIEIFEKSIFDKTWHNFILNHNCEVSKPIISFILVVLFVKYCFPLSLFYVL